MMKTPVLSICGIIVLQVILLLNFLTRKKRNALRPAVVLIYILKMIYQNYFSFMMVPYRRIIL